MTTTTQELQTTLDAIRTDVETYPPAIRAFMLTFLFESATAKHYRNGAPAAWAYSNYYDLLLDLSPEARATTVRSDEAIGLMAESQCYGNCAEVICEYTGYTYVEGMAQTDAMFLVRHAWLEDADGNIVDPTWANIPSIANKPATYFGVRFAGDFLLSHVVRTGRYSVFDADWQDDHRVLRHGLKLNDAGFACDLGDPR
ncbi:MAG: hypothetical protein HOV97_05850 [Nonomuraea sp.]|nr:hypothetical protein [Nonomuraea sp.]